MTLIKRTSDSSECEIKILLSGVLLKDRKTTDIQQRAQSHNVPDKLMLELCPSDLQSSVQKNLASISPFSLEKATEVADRILENNPATVHAI